MPKLTRRLPSYRLHKVSGQAVVTLNGRDHYLGPHGSSESYDAYKRVISEWTATRAAMPPPTEPDAPAKNDLRICELLASYLEHAKRYYVKNGQPTGEHANVKDAIRPLQELYDLLPVAQFGPTALKAVRQRMVENDLARTVVNARINRIRRVLKWGVESQVVEPGVLHALQAVAPLRHGRSEARETGPVRPVSDASVAAVLKNVTPQVRAMIELQEITGMRPNEVTAMRQVDIETKKQPWVYRPARHKTEHHGIERLIYLGPKAQQILRPFLNRPPDTFLFCPKDAVKHVRDRLRKRKTRPSSMRATKTRPKRAAGVRYTRRSYYRAIARACEKAGIDTWGPNRLRHSAATRLRKQFGIEAARVVLGHRSSAVTEVYAELDRSKAADIMAEIG